MYYKVEKILKNSLDSILSPSRSCEHFNFLFSFFGQTLLGIVNKLFGIKSLLTTPSNVLPLHLKPTFPPIIWIFTEGGGIEFRRSSKIFFTLTFHLSILMSSSKSFTNFKTKTLFGETEFVYLVLCKFNVNNNNHSWKFFWNHVVNR